MKKRAAAILAVCVLGLVTFLGWPPATEEESHDAEYYFKRAWGDFSGMIADSARASEVIPSAQIPLKQMGYPAETSLRLLRGGLRNYDRAIAHNPAFSWGYYHRGVLKHLANDLEGALADFR